MTETEEQVGGWGLDAGALCLDFSNTVDPRGPEGRRDWLTGYAALLVWSVQAGALTGPRADALRQRAAERPGEAEAVFRQAVALREAIYRTFSAIARGGRPDQADLHTINAALATAMARVRVAAVNGSFTWEWRGADDDLGAMLWPVARSAAELLTSPDLQRVRECGWEPCGWLFIDTTRNRSRRWCSMATCGNRAKARRHYARTRRAATGEASTAGEAGDP